jgi:hypothetical protein
MNPTQLPVIALVIAMVFPTLWVEGDFRTVRRHPVEKFPNRSTAPTADYTAAIASYPMPLIDKTSQKSKVKSRIKEKTLVVGFKPTLIKKNCFETASL